MQNMMTYIAYAVGAIFMLIGLTLLFTDIFSMSRLPSELKTMMGVVLFLYGSFRVVVTIYKKRQQNEEPQ
jgi:hypothetical protein